jgi:hypothetical protein
VLAIFYIVTTPLSGRTYIRDPDGYIIEVGQTTNPQRLVARRVATDQLRPAFRLSSENRPQGGPTAGYDGVVAVKEQALVPPWSNLTLTSYLPAVELPPHCGTPNGRM